MALVLGVMEGEAIYIDDRKLTLERIVTPTRFIVKLEGPMDAIYEISENERIEILPDVYLSAGNTGSMSTAKIALEAPRDKIILREKLYQQKHV